MLSDTISFQYNFRLSVFPHFLIFVIRKLSRYICLCTPVVYDSLMFLQRVEVCKPFDTGFTYMRFRASMDTLMTRQKLEPYKPFGTGFTHKYFSVVWYLGQKNVFNFFFRRTIIFGVARRFWFFDHKDFFL